MTSVEENNNKTAPVGRKIHQFEHGERERVEQEEKAIKKAIFQRKLNKFTPPPNQEKERAVRKLSEVEKLAKKFSEIPKSDGEAREIQRRREEFEKKRSGFLSQEGQLEVQNCDSVDAKSQMERRKLFFEDKDAALALEEEEAEKKRRQMEELEERKRNFDAKSEVFKKLSQEASKS